MSTTETETKTKLDDGTMNQWPPVAHIRRKEDRHRPVRAGDLGLCGAKLMGIDLARGRSNCKKCLKIALGSL